MITYQRRLSPAKRRAIKRSIRKEKGFLNWMTKLSSEIRAETIITGPFSDYAILPSFSMNAPPDGRCRKCKVRMEEAGTYLLRCPQCLRMAYTLPSTA